MFTTVPGILFFDDKKKKLPSVDKEKGASLILRTTSAVIKKIHELFIIRPVTNTYFTIRIFDHKTIRIQIFEYLKLGQKHAKKTARRHSLKLVTALSHWDSSSSRSCTSMQLYMQYMLSLAWNYIINWQKYHPFMILVFWNLQCSAHFIIMVHFSPHF